jgi:2-dehydropantoate 2-reductase
VLQLKDKVKTDTVIIPLMNGVNIYETIRETIDTGIILPSCVYVASHIKSKGVIEHKGKPGKIICGQDPLNDSFNATKAIDTLLNAGIDIEFTEDPYPAIWSKFLFIASFGLTSARYNRPMGEIIENEILHNRAEQIMQEILSIARKKRIQLPENSIELTFRKAATFPYTTPTSLQLDIHSGNKNNELELFGGAIIKYGQLTGTDTTQTAKIVHEISQLTT